MLAGNIIQLLHRTVSAHRNHPGRQIHLFIFIFLLFPISRVNSFADLLFYYYFFFLSASAAALWCLYACVCVCVYVFACVCTSFCGRPVRGVYYRHVEEAVSANWCVCVCVVLLGWWRRCWCWLLWYVNGRNGGGGGGGRKCCDCVRNAQQGVSQGNVWCIREEQGNTHVVWGGGGWLGEEKVGVKHQQM